jgi:hypothetical protein
MAELSIDPVLAPLAAHVAVYAEIAALNAAAKNVDDLDTMITDGALLRYEMAAGFVQHNADNA